MSVRRTVTVGVIAAALWAHARSGDAQQVRRYQPATPTISPYLNLFRFNNGPLPNYYSLVRPQLQQQVINRDNLAIQTQQASNILRLQNDLRMTQEQAARGGGAATPTGKRAWFQSQGRAGYMTSNSYFQGVRSPPISARQ